jgi:hypothetical protein
MIHLRERFSQSVYQRGIRQRVFEFGAANKRKHYILVPKKSCALVKLRNKSIVAKRTYITWDNPGNHIEGSADDSQHELIRPMGLVINSDAPVSVYYATAR